MVHPDAVCHGISETVKKKLTDLIKSNFDGVIPPKQDHIWLKMDEQKSIMNLFKDCCLTSDD